MKALPATLILISIVLCLSSTHAQYEGWVHFFTNTAGDQFYFHPESISKLPNSVMKVRVKGSSQREKVTMRGFEQVIEIECQKRIYRKLESRITRTDGSVFESKAQSDWTAMESGSSTEALADKVCRMTSRRNER